MAHWAQYSDSGTLYGSIHIAPVSSFCYSRCPVTDSIAACIAVCSIAACNAVCDGTVCIPWQRRSSVHSRRQALISREAAVTDKRPGSDLSFCEFAQDYDE